MMKLFGPKVAQQAQAQTRTKRANPLEKHPGDLVGQKASIEETQSFEAFLQKARRAEKTAQRPEGTDPDAVGEAAKQFESFFLAQILKNMRQTIPKDGLFEQGFSSEVYTEMLDQEYARSLSESGGIGLADVLERQFLGETPPQASEGLNAPEEFALNNSKQPPADDENDF